MINTPRGNWRKILVAIGISSFLLLLVHQLSYIGSDAFSINLQESIRTINACPQPPFEPSHDPEREVASNIPNVIHQIWKTADVNTYSIEASRD